MALAKLALMICGTDGDRHNWQQQKRDGHGGATASWQSNKGGLTTNVKMKTAPNSLGKLVEQIFLRSSLVLFDHQRAEAILIITDIDSRLQPAPARNI